MTATRFDGSDQVAAGSTFAPARLAAAGLALILALGTAPASALPAGAIAAQGEAVGVSHATAGSYIQRVAVFGRDDRRPLIGRRAELRERIGMLRHRGTGASCTAFCVAPDIVATAGHCVSGTRAEPSPDARLLQFRRDVDPALAATGIAGADAGDVSRSLMTGSAGLRTRPPINATSDWAFVRLARPACAAGGFRLSRLSPEEIAVRTREGRVFHVAYHRDFGTRRLAIGRPCRVLVTPPAAHRAMLERDFEAPRNLLLHLCDTGAASSGSPLLTDGPDGPEVIGINVGTYVRSRVIESNGETVQRISSETVANTALATAPLLPLLGSFATHRESGVVPAASGSRAPDRMAARERMLERTANQSYAAAPTRLPGRQVVPLMRARAAHDVPNMPE